MREQFAAAGFEPVDEKAYADVYIINTCTVTNLADRKSRQYIRRMKKKNPDAIKKKVTGKAVCTEKKARPSNNRTANRISAKSAAVNKTAFFKLRLRFAFR